jgi:hypothetical protein
MARRRPRIAPGAQALSRNTDTLSRLFLFCSGRWLGSYDSRSMALVPSADSHSGLATEILH